MPQFDITQFSSQIFWLLLCFGILYIFTIFYTLPRLKEIHRIRFAAMEEKIALADQLKDQSQKLIQDYETQLAQARAVTEAELAAKIHELNTHTHMEKITADQKIKSTSADQKDIISQRLSREIKGSSADLDTLAEELAAHLLKVNTRFDVSKSREQDTNQDRGMS